MDGQVGLSIGRAAKAAGLSVKTLRYYEEIGLVSKARRTNGAAHAYGRRIYAEADIGRLRFIHEARLLGLSLADIRDLLALAEGRGCPSGQPEYRRILEKHLREIDDRLRHLAALRATIEALLAPPHRPEGQACSWVTCDCMQSTEPAPAPAGKGRTRGGRNV